RVQALWADVCLLLLIEFAVKPGFGFEPFALDGDGRDAEHLRRLFDAKSAEVAQLDDAALALINRTEAVERFVERQQVNRFFRRSGDGLIKCDAQRRAAAPCIA